MKHLTICFLVIFATFLQAQTTPLATFDANYTQFFSNTSIEYNGSMYFIAANSTHGSELWKTDGTAAGTMMVKDINPGYAGAFSSEYLRAIVYKSKLYFVANHPSYGFELWRTDGTTAGTELFVDIAPGAGNGTPFNMVVVANRLVFAYFNGSTTQLYRSLGTVASTVAVTTFQTVYDIYSNGTYALMSARSASGGGTDLFRTDGTGNGTYLLKDIAPGAGNSFPSHFAKFGNSVIFEANDDVHGYEKWISDGTNAGTYMVMDIFPGGYDGVGGFYGTPNGLEHNGYFYFAANDPTAGLELWRTNGTVTERLSDANPGTANSLIGGNNIFAHGNFVTMVGYPPAGTYNYDIANDTILPTGYFSHHLQTFGAQMFTMKNGIQYYASSDTAYGFELRRNNGDLPNGEEKIQELILRDNHSPLAGTASPYRFMGFLGNLLITRCPKNLSSLVEFRAFDTAHPLDCVSPSVSTVCRISNTRTDIIWNRTPNIGNYEIQYRAQGASTWILKTAPRSFYSMTGLVLNTVYEYQLRSYCGSAFTPWSETYTFTNSASTVPAFLLAERNDSPTSERIYWQKNSGYTKAAFRHRIPGTTSWLATSTATSGVKIISGLTPNTFYEYEARAYHSSGVWDPWQKGYFVTVPDNTFRPSARENEVDEPLANQEISISPNPVTAQNGFYLNLRLDSESVDNQLIITNLAGKNCHQQTFNLLVGENSIFVKPENLSAGIYFLQIRNAFCDLLFVEKVVFE